MTRLEKWAAIAGIAALFVGIVSAYLAYLAIPTPPIFKPQDPGPVSNPNTQGPKVPSIPIPTSLTLTTDEPNPVHGQEVTYTAHVTADGRVPSGYIAFSLGKEWRRQTLDQEGKAEFKTVVRNDATINAVYHPAEGFATTRMASLGITVGPVEIVVNVEPPAYNPEDKTYTLRAVVSPRSPGAVELSGTVWFLLDGVTRLRPNAPLRGTSAELPSVRIRPGHSIVAEFVPSPDAPHLSPSRSLPFPFTE